MYKPRLSNVLTLVSMMLALTAAVPAQSTNGQIVSVRTFGAVGDGVSDDRPAIQAALEHAQGLSHATVLFPAGTYLLRSSTQSYGQLSLNGAGTPFSVNLIGTDATLETSGLNSPILLIQGHWQDSKIQGLTFVNTHAVTDQQTTAIEFSGGPANAATNWTIANNTFRNFSRHISVAGVNGLSIDNNTFLMAKGRDSGAGSNMVEPTVGIWLFDNSPNGASTSISIQGNTYNGCMQSGPVSKLCGDGFVFGMARSATVSHNSVAGFSFEGIFLKIDTVHGVKVPSQLKISNNLIKATGVAGDVAGGGQWGIRCDADDCVVSQNTITDAITGIESYTADSAANASNIQITNNIISLAAPTVSRLSSVTTLFTPAANVGISSTGVDSVKIIGNQISFPNAAHATRAWKINGVFLTGANSNSRMAATPTIDANTLKADGPSEAGVINGLQIQWASNYGVASNMISGTNVGIDFLNMWPAQPTALVSANIIDRTTFLTTQH